MSRGGFTLVEVLVATVVTAVVVSLATAVVGSTVDHGRRAERRALTHQAEMADLAWLRQIASGVSLEEGASFEGTPTSTTFSSAVWNPEGWLTVRGIRLVAEEEGGLELDVEETLSRTLFAAETIRLEYLIMGPDGRTWVPGWASRFTPPLALRIHRSGATDGEPKRLTLLMGGGP